MLDLKKDFPIFKNHPDLVYLDSAATAQMPQVVVEAIAEYNTDYRTNVHRGAYGISERATQAYEGARAAVAECIGAEHNEVVFTSGTTGSMNMLAYMLEHSLDLKKGDGIVVSKMEHHSSFLPFQELAKRKECTFTPIPLTASYGLNLDQLETIIGDNTKVVVVTLASNVLGTINDVVRVAKRAHDVGALMVVDAAKAIGHVPIDVKDLECDFLAFSGHKFFGPTGIGVLYGREGELENLHPGFYGGGMVLDVTPELSVYSESPFRFEAGTPDIAGAIGLGEAVRYVRDLDVLKIHEHISALLEYAFTALGEVPGITLYAERAVDHNAGVISFTLEGVHPHDIGEVCSRHNVAIRAGHHCALPLMEALGISGTARASFHVYNTKEDVNALVDALTETKQLFQTTR